MSATRGDRARVFLLTAGGLGFAPVASGTFGSLGGVILAVPIQTLVPARHVGVCWLLLALALFLVGVALGPFAVRRFGRKDPGEVVLDEVAGYLVTVALLALTGPLPGTGGHVLAFLLFRAADVLKPPPARQLESLRDGLGIMADDVVAGVYAGLALLVLRLLVPAWL